MSDDPRDLDHLPDDIASVWPARATFMPTEDLLSALAEHYPARWSSDSPFGRELTAQRMGRYLAVQCGITSSRDHANRRGYRLDEIESAWSAAPKGGVA